MSSKWTSWILTIIQAVALYFITIYLISNPDLTHLAETFGIISVIFVLNRVISTIDFSLIHSESTKRLMQQMNGMGSSIANISRIIETGDSLEVDQIKQIHSAYISLTEEKLGAIRDRIIAKALSELRELRATMRTPVMEEPDFYNWLYQTFDSAKSGSTISIVSMNETLEWTDTPQEKRFFECNVSAAKRGVKIERIFYFDNDARAKSRSNQYIYAHRKNNVPNLIGKCVDASSFKRAAPTAVHDAGQGFILVDNRFAIVDVFSLDGKARGFVTFNAVEVSNYAETFQRFNSLSTPLIYN